MTYDDAPSEMWDVLNNCDHIGMLTRKGYLAVRDVWSDMGYWLLNIYADAEPIIEADRKGDTTSDRKPSPASMSDCTWLIEQMRPIEATEDNGTENQPSPQDLYNFYDEELAEKPGGLTTRRSKK